MSLWARVDWGRGMGNSGSNDWPYKAQYFNISEYSGKVVLKCRSGIIDLVNRRSLPSKTISLKLAPNTGDSKT